MAKKIIIDGFNFFHRWGRTKKFFRKSSDLSAALDRALEMLGQTQVAKRQKMVVALDGDTSLGKVAPNLIIRQAGAGRKADDAILEMLRHLSHPGEITVVTTDRELGAEVIRLGGRPQTVEKFLLGLDRKTQPRASHIPHGKPLTLSRREVEKWLAIFGDGSDIEAEEE